MEYEPRPPCDAVRHAAVLKSMLSGFRQGFEEYMRYTSTSCAFKTDFKKPIKAAVLAAAQCLNAAIPAGSEDVIADTKGDSTSMHARFLPLAPYNI